MVIKVFDFNQSPSTNEIPGQKSMKYCLICCLVIEVKLLHECQKIQKIQTISLLHSFFIEKSTELCRGKILDFWQALNTLQKQPSRGVLKKRYSENMQQIYRRTLMLKCDFNKVAWNRTLTWVISCKFAAYFQNTFS